MMRSLPYLLSLLVLCMPPAAAEAQEVRRCTGPDGEAVFTDRRCEDIGGIERRPPVGAGGHARPYRGGCARSLQDLVSEVAAAFDNRDANRLAGVYHWAGLSGSAAYPILARLDGLVRHPLVAITPLMPTRTEGGAAADGNLYPQTSVRTAPVALRLDQTLGTGATPAQTVFGLHRHFGCWWLRF